MRRVYFIILALVLLVLSFNLGMTTANTYPPEMLLQLVNLQESEEIEIAEESGDNDNDGADRSEIPKETTLEAEEEPEPDLRTAKMVTTGNIIAHLLQIHQAELDDGQYDFSPSFEIIAPYLQNADLTVGDLEVMQASEDIASPGNGLTGYTGYPEFNAPPEFSEALYEAGINTFTLANNHALDRGLEGLEMTIEHLRSLGASTFGAYLNLEERETPLIIDVDGINIALIGYTYGLNGNIIPGGHEYSVNLAPDFEDISPLITAIETAQSHGADLVAVFPHWGAEAFHEPEPQRLRQVAEELARAGADLIIGGHPKYIQPFEWFFYEEEDGSERAALAIYSQGSFISNQHEGDGYNSIYNEFGLLLDIDLTKNQDSKETWISGLNYEITWVHREWRHRVLPVSEVLSASPEDYNLTDTDFDRLSNIYDFTVDVLHYYGHGENKARAMAISEQLYQEAYDKH